MATVVKWVPRGSSGLVAPLAGTMRDGPGRTKGILSLDVPTDVALAGVARDAPGRVRGQLYTTSGGDPAILFAAQWRTPGDSDLIRRDNGAGGARFTIASSGPTVVTAASTGLSGWPTTYVLSVPSAEEGPSEGAVIRKTGLGVPAVGSYRFYRIYFAMTLDTPDPDNDNMSHCVQDGLAGDAINWEFTQVWNVSTIDPYWVANFQMTPTATPDRVARLGGFTTPTLLDRWYVYRFEWRIHRITTSTFTLHPRVYDNSGTLLYGPDDFIFFNPGTYGSLATRTMTFNDVNILDGLQVGSNQSWWMPAGSSPQCFQAAVAVSDSTDPDGWLGPYNAATEATWDE